jgi:hypothetical protein
VIAATAKDWVAGGAILSAPPRRGDRPLYRYALERWWDPQRPFVLWVLLNPSHADASTPDDTVDRCLARSQAWGGFGGLRIVNLFAWRDPKPQSLAPLGFESAVGNPHNDHFIAAHSSAAALTVVGWGDGNGIPRTWLSQRERDMALLLVKPHCLGVTAQSHPRHPKPQNASQLPLGIEPRPWLPLPE